jgi:hypothetical protein
LYMIADPVYDDIKCMNIVKRIGNISGLSC